MLLLNVLFPKVRAELLRVLFSDPAVELHLRELVRRTGLGLGTVQERTGQTGGSGADPQPRRWQPESSFSQQGASRVRGTSRDVVKTAGVCAVLADSLGGLEGWKLAFVSVRGHAVKPVRAATLNLMVIGQPDYGPWPHVCGQPWVRCGREINRCADAGRVD